MKEKIMYKLGALLVLVAILSVIVNAETFLIQDSKDIAFMEEIVEVNFMNESDEVKKYLTTNSTGHISIELPKSVDKVEFLIRVAGTFYYGTSSADSYSVHLKPVARLTGFVLDSKDNLLKEAGLKIVCSSPISLMPEHTDDIGYFEISEVGMGECIISVIKDRRITTYTVNITESKEYALQIRIDEPKKDNRFIAIIIGAVILLLIALIYYKLSGSYKNAKVKNEVKQDSAISSDFSERQVDIMKTLSQNENIIIQSLVKHNGHATQSQIRHETNLPKATLHRHLLKLLQKGIVSVEEYGNLKKVILTEFFMKK